MEQTIRVFSPADGLRTPPLQQTPWYTVRDLYLEPPQFLTARGFNLGVKFVWEEGDRRLVRGSRTYELRLSTHEDLSDALVFSGLKQFSVDVDSLLLGQTYYWEVSGWEKGQRVSRSDLHHFHTHAQPPRWLTGNGVVNLRDAGGWPTEDGKRVRQGLVYRSAEMNNHLQLDSKAKKYLTERLGIRTDLDLRNSLENPHAALDREQVQYCNLPILDYARLVQDWSAEGTRQIFKLLADRSNYPVLVHCWGGADRTGTLVFLINALAGVSDEDLYHDYELTTLGGLGVRLIESDLFQPFLALLRASAPQGAPTRVQAEQLLLGMGVPAEHIEAVRSIMVE